MADRYWVGGTGTWNTSSTTNWSATSGGAGGASVPTSADNVFINGSSGTGTVTVSGAVVCRNFDCTGYTGTFSGTMTVYGTVFTLSTGMTASFSSILYFYPPASSTVNITTAGKTLNTVAFGDISTIGQSYALQDALTLNNTITLNNGTFTTNNFNVSASSLASSNSNVRTINLGSSTVTLTGGTPIDFSTSTNLTFNAGTSTINCTTASAFTIQGGVGVTFYNLNITGGATSNVFFNGVNTFNNLSVTANTAGTKLIQFNVNQTINGSLTTSGTTATQRIQFQSSAAGTQRTISLATIGTLTNTNWKDIALTGAASPWTAPMSAYDLGNNSGITFDTTPLYWVGGTGTWTDATHWSTSSGGAGGAGVPGPTNNVRIDANSGTGTLTGSGASYCKDYDSSGSSITNSSVSLATYGSFKCRSGVTNSFVGFTFNGTGTHTVDPNGSTNMSAGGGFQFRGTGTYTLMNNWVSSNSFSLFSGTLNTNGYSVSGNVFSCSGALAKTLNLGASTLTFTTSTAFDFSGTNLTLNAGTSTLNCGANFNGGTGNTFYNLNLTMISASNQQIDGSSTFNNFTVTGPSSVGVKRITLSGNNTINGTLTAIGSNGNQRIAFLSLDYITPITLSAANVSLVDVDFNKIVATGSASWSGTRIGNIGQNTGITFTAPKTVYWNLAAGGDLYTATGWAATSGGTPATTNMPLGQDTAIIENTGLNSGATVSYGTLFSTVPNLTFSSRTLPVTFNINTTVYVAGDITLSSAVTPSGNNSTIFSGTTNLTVAGKTWPCNPLISGTLSIADTATFSSTATSQTYVGGTLTLNAPLTFSAVGFTNNGTINLNSYTLTSTTCTLAAASTTNFGTGKISLTGNATTIFTGDATQTVKGTPVVECTYSGATGTRSISAASTETNSVSFNITAGSDIVTFVTSSLVKDLDFTGFTGTLTNQTRTVYGSLTISSGMTLTAGASATNFRSTSGTKTITTNGKTLDFPITFNGVGGTWQLADNLLQGSARTTILTNGTLDLNGKTYTPGSIFQINAGTKNITFNGGTLLCTGTNSAFFNNAPTNFTTTAGTGTGKISLNNASAKTFTGAGSVYNCTLENAGAGALTITDSNTFTTISNSVQPTSFLFTAGTTTTVTNFNVSGTSGNLVTIGSVTAASHTLSKSSGIVDVSYCTIFRSTATGGATWKAYTSNGNVNGGNNSGWLFSASSGNGLLFGSNF